MHEQMVLNAIWGGGGGGDMLIWSWYVVKELGFVEFLEFIKQRIDIKI